MEAKHARQLDRCRVPHYSKFEFDHTGRGYWVVKGLVPLDVAQILYADPVGKTDIRVDGHCGCPAPEPPWTTLRMPDGTELLTLDDKEQLEATKHLNPDFYEDYMKQFSFSDDPEVRAKAKCYVEMYHIDTEIGLRVFIDHLRWFNLI